MNYLACTRCGLTIRLRAPYPTIKHCPRCIARARIALPMEPTEGPCLWNEQNPEQVHDASSGTSLPASTEDRTTSTSP